MKLLKGLQEEFYDIMNEYICDWWISKLKIKLW
jgi:hypothetical protein